MIRLCVYFLCPPTHKKDNTAPDAVVPHFLNCWLSYKLVLNFAKILIFKIPTLAKIILKIIVNFKENIVLNYNISLFIWKLVHLVYFSVYLQVFYFIYSHNISSFQLNFSQFKFAERANHSFFGKIKGNSPKCQLDATLLLHNEKSRFTIS